MDYLGVFAAGFFYEWTAVYWTHYSERGRAAATGLTSAAQAVALVFGVGESARDWRHAPLFVLGYALGSYCAVRAKSRG